MITLRVKDSDLQFFISFKCTVRIVDSLKDIIVTFADNLSKILNTDNEHRNLMG